MKQVYIFCIYYILTHVNRYHLRSHMLFCVRYVPLEHSTACFPCYLYFLS